MSNECFEGISFKVINHREHCRKLKHRKNDWDTVKPLGNRFGAYGANVTLIDDSWDKVMSHERKQLLWIPYWDGSENDHVLIRLLWMLVTVRSMKLRNLNYMTEFISRTLFETSVIICKVKDGCAYRNARMIMRSMCLPRRFFASNREASECDLVTDEDTGEVFMVKSCRTISRDSRKDIIDKLRE